MAASGIAEHDEARRRERGYLHKAYLMKQSIEAEKEKQRQLQLDVAMGRTRPSGHNSYDCEVQRRMQLGSSRDAVDRARREAHLKDMNEKYSAKIANRYTSIDYQSQW